ncbi:MAG TPA: hypothetical protein DCL77_11945 [Prolixibacteraceae bacterium]|jgi:hypothetical protein|nr:hypothetical protein [Prolixibacteraceae bacterium]
MERKNLIRIRTLLLMLVVSSALFVSSCSKSDNSTPAVVDRAALTKALASADSLSTALTTDDYDQADIDAYKATLATAKTASTSSTLTQAQVNSLVGQIKAAMTLLNSKAFGFINETLNLVAGWKFDEGTGTTATSYSTAKQVGTFMKGFTVLLGANAALPTWVPGVKGGTAIHLSNGAHLEVPYSPSFLPASISISAWIKMDKPGWENNAIVSQNYWYGYKFQTQSAGYPLFTEKISPTSVQDKDAGVAVAPGVWTQVAVALNSATDSLQFFINGALIITYTASDGIGPLTQTLSFVDAGYTYTAQPFLIGAFATDAELAAKPLNFNWITTANVASFEGAIDNLKVYNVALKPGQVKKLYNDEKP